MPSRPCSPSSSTRPLMSMNTVLVVGLFVRERAHDAALLDHEPARVVVRSLQHRDRRGERQVRVARQRDVSSAVGRSHARHVAFDGRASRPEGSPRRRWWRWRRCRWRRRSRRGWIVRARVLATAARVQTDSASSKAAHLAALFSRPRMERRTWIPRRRDAIADAIGAAKCRGRRRVTRRPARAVRRVEMRIGGAARMLPNALQPTSRADRTPR